MDVNVLPQRSMYLLDLSSVIYLDHVIYHQIVFTVYFCQTTTIILQLLYGHFLITW